MTRTRSHSLPTLFAGCLAVGAIFLSSAALAEAGSSSGPGPGVALAAKKAATLDAEAEYWNTIATCLNEEGDPDDLTELIACMKEAEEALDEALELIEAQFVAKIALLQLLGETTSYDPDLDGDDFTPDITNHYFPLVPGRTLVYEVQTDEGLERIEVTTMNETIEIAGVTCRVVRDLVTVDGEVKEDTTDWYAQDEDGNVWYMGEIALNYEDGFLDNIDGSWRAEVDEAKPGIRMLAAPLKGAAYRQEFLVNEAEDYGEVLATDVTVFVPKFGRFKYCLQTLDATPLEPDHIEHKFYAPGIGLVMETKPGSNEVLYLVDIIDHP